MLRRCDRQMWRKDRASAFQFDWFPSPRKLARKVLTAGGSHACARSRAFACRRPPACRYVRRSSARKIGLRNPTLHRRHAAESLSSAESDPGNRHPRRGCSRQVLVPLTEWVTSPVLVDNHVGGTWSDPELHREQGRWGGRRHARSREKRERERERERERTEWVD